MRKVAVFAVVALCGSPLAGAQATRSGKTDTPPNVVIYLIDTLRADRLGVYGYDRLPTSPFIDRLAAESVVFEQAYAPAPWTLPSLASLFTSTFPCEHQVLLDTQRLSPSLLTLAERLGGAGYTTLDLYGNDYASEYFGLARGFGYISGFHVRQGARIGKELKDHGHSPYFLYIHAIEPHHPHLYAPLHIDGFRDVLGGTRQAINDAYVAYRRATRAGAANGGADASEEQRRQMDVLNTLRDDYNELYDTAVRAADTHLEAQIAALKQRGEWGKTLFILVADHGEEMFEHGGWLHDQSVYDELMHVPLIIHFPRGRFGGRRLQSVVSLVDVLPTIMDYLGRSELSDGARGESLMPLIRGQTTDDIERLAITGMRINRKKLYKPWKEQRGDENIVIRQGKWKGIWNVEPNSFELYDLTADARELRDLSDEHPDLASTLRDAGRRWREQCGSRASTPDAPREEMDEETRARLRELGYVD